MTQSSDETDQQLRRARSGSKGADQRGIGGRDQGVSTRAIASVSSTFRRERIGARSPSRAYGLARGSSKPRFSRRFPIPRPISSSTAAVALGARGGEPRTMRYLAIATAAFFALGSTATRRTGEQGYTDYALTLQHDRFCDWETRGPVIMQALRRDPRALPR